MAVLASPMALVRTTTVDSPVGPLVLGACDGGICLLEFSEEKRLAAQLRTLEQRIGCPIEPGKHEHLDLLADQLKRYFAGALREFHVPLFYRGTAFQEQVWRGLLAIPYGATWSYEELAQSIGKPTAQRAVGLANGKNPIAIVIPCHRVINKGGKLGGYGGGLWRKQRLLELERGG